MGVLGLARVAQLELRYIELPGAIEHTIDVPVHLNVVRAIKLPAGCRTPSCAVS